MGSNIQAAAPQRQDVQLFLLLGEGFQFSYPTNGSVQLCATLSASMLGSLPVGKFQLFHYNYSYRNEGGMCIATGNNTYPICLWLPCVLVCLNILEDAMSLSTQPLARQDAPTRRHDGSCVVTSFYLSVILSFCLSVCYSRLSFCLHQGRREDKC